MKTIEDAVIVLRGKLPESRKYEHNLARHEYPYYFKNDEFRKVFLATAFGANSTICTIEEFESCAKRLGYINGYKWGVEYPTNGERPELPDGVLVHGRYDFLQNEWGEDNQVAGEAAWHHITAFRITDQRYKPAEPASEYEPVIIAGGDIASGGGGGFMPKAEPYFPPKKPAPAKPWFEAGELPPVGYDDFEWSLNGKYWEHGVMLFNDGTTCLIANKKYPANRHHLKSFDPDLSFRPIRTRREKVIEAVDSLIHDYQAGAEIRTEYLNVLYGAGMLVLPQDSGNTEA